MFNCSTRWNIKLIVEHLPGVEYYGIIVFYSHQIPVPWHNITMQLYGKLAEAPGVARGIKNTLGKLYSNSEKSVEF